MGAVKTRQPHTGPITAGHIYGIRHFKFRKFGGGHLAWLSFEEWLPDIVGRKCRIEQLKDCEAEVLIGAMKRLHDVEPEGQESLF
jgi:hypothetical protein